jgi:soluble lytic murein transglycosylase-like protein
MSSVLGATAGTGVGAAAAAERMQQLQTLIAQVERGPAGFAAALDSAQAGASATQAAGASSPGASTASGSAAATPSEAARPYVPLIEQAAARNGIDPAVLYGLIEQESGFDPNATSSAGALGLTQLMPGTASSLGVSEPLNPAQSIEGGARYLGQMLRQFSGNTADALAAYNAGPGAVQQYGGVPPYSETQQYVSKVLANAAAYSSTAPAGATETVA